MPVQEAQLLQTTESLLQRQREEHHREVSRKPAHLPHQAAKATDAVLLRTVLPAARKATEAVPHRAVTEVQATEAALRQATTEVPHQATAEVLHQATTAAHHTAAAREAAVEVAEEATAEAAVQEDTEDKRHHSI